MYSHTSFGKPHAQLRLVPQQAQQDLTWPLFLALGIQRREFRRDQSQIPSVGRLILPGFKAVELEGTSI